jgi:GT2 family glycosyltransferase
MLGKQNQSFTPKDNLNKKISIIIISYNTCDILQQCLNKIDEYRKSLPIETIVVDNASKDLSVEMIKNEFPETLLIENTTNMGFAPANNQGIKVASGDYVLLLNSDAYLMPDTLESTLKYMAMDPKTGILGVQLINEDGSNQVSARTLPNPWHKILMLTGLTSRFPQSKLFGNPDYSNGKTDKIRNVGWVPGAYFMIRKEVLDDIGFLDERYFMYYEEVDFCLRTQKAGWEVTFYPETKVIHLGGASSQTTKREISASGKQLLNFRIESEIYYYAKHYGPLYVWITTIMEVFWRSMIWLKNWLIRDKFSSIKQREAALTIKLFLIKFKNYLAIPVSN